MIGQTIGNDQFAVEEQSAAGINDFGHVAFTLVLVRLEQGFGESSNHFGGIIAIEEEGVCRAPLTGRQEKFELRFVWLHGMDSNHEYGVVLNARNLLILRR